MSAGDGESSAKKDKYAGLLPLQEEVQRDRYRTALLGTGILQFLYVVGLIIGVRVIMFSNDCGSPVQFDLPYNFTKFQETGNMCHLGYYLLGFTTTALSVLLAQGILAIVNSRLMHYFTLLMGMFFFGLFSFGLLIFFIVMAATGFPFAAYCIPVFMLFLLNVASFAIEWFLRPFYKKMKEELAAKEQDQKDKDRDRDRIHQPMMEDR
jgi:hypothetical protein